MGRLHPFFATHDLTHSAVESGLRLDQAFFGLIASGLSIDDFAQPGPAGRPSLEALSAEEPPTPLLSDSVLHSIQSLPADPIAQWEALPTGETLRVGLRPH